MGMYSMSMAWYSRGIDPQLLPEAGMLGEAGSHATASRRARSRAVSVGPRYSWATRSS